MDMQAVTWERIGPDRWRIIRPEAADRPHCQYEQHEPYDVCMLVHLPWRPRRAMICLACHPLPDGWPVKARGEG